jgi:phage tail-like protein
MAEQRDYPYGTFNFLVDFSAPGGAQSLLAGFQEVSGLNIEVTSSDYRVGNSKDNHGIKVNGIYKAGDVTFKRGLIGALDLFTWIKAVREGDQTMRRQVTVQLKDESHAKTVMTWTLLNARPMRYTAPALNAKTGTEVAIEELVLSCEDLEVS